DPRAHLNRPRTMNEQHRAVEPEADDQNFDDVAPAWMQKPELFEEAHDPCVCCIVAQPTSSASRFTFASCPRNSLAPRSRAATFAPTVPKTRSPGAGASMIAVVKRCRDSPTR